MSPCPHCQEPMTESAPKHCGSPTCDWRRCTSCGSNSVGRRHIHGKDTIGPCKGATTRGAR